MRRRGVLAGAASAVLGACSQAPGVRPSFGIVVDYDLLPGAAMKHGVAALSDTGVSLFSPAVLRQRTSVHGSSGGRNAYSGRELPRWVRITWRSPDFDMDFHNGGWKGGTLLGDHRIEVASRIPRETLAYASAVHGRALRLIFWLTDDGVLLGWDVQEPPDGTTWRYALHGGDFVEPEVYNGKLVRPGWYLTPDGRTVIIER